LSESRGCPSFKASNGEGVVAYPEPLATQKMGLHRLSRVVFRVNKMGFKMDHYNSPISELELFVHYLNIDRNIRKIKNYPLLFTLI